MRRAFYAFVGGCALCGVLDLGACGNDTFSSEGDAGSDGAPDTATLADASADADWCETFGSQSIFCDDFDKEIVPGGAWNGVPQVDDGGRISLSREDSVSPPASLLAGTYAGPDPVRADVSETFPLSDGGVALPAHVSFDMRLPDDLTSCAPTSPTLLRVAAMHFGPAGQLSFDDAGGPVNLLYLALASTGQMWITWELGKSPYLAEGTTKVVADTFRSGAWLRVKLDLTPTMDDSGGVSSIQVDISTGQAGSDDNLTAVIGSPLTMHEADGGPINVSTSMFSLGLNDWSNPPAPVQSFDCQVRYDNVDVY